MLFCEFYLFLPCLSVIFGFAFCVLCLFVLVLLGYLVANGFCRRSVGAPVDEKEVSVSLVSLSFLPPPLFGTDGEGMLDMLWVGLRKALMSTDGRRRSR